MAQDSNVIIPQSAIEGITKTNTEIVKLDESTYKFIQTVDQLATSLKNNKITLEQVQKAQKKTQENVKKSTSLEKEQKKASEALEKQRQKGLSQLAKVEAKEREFQKALNLTVKSEQDLITKTNALVKKRKQLDLTTKDGVKQYAKLSKEITNNTNKLKQSDAQIGRFQRNVGNYKSALKGFGGQLLAVSGIALGVAGVFKGLQTVISSTQLVGDKFEAFLGGAKEGFNFLARSIANLDFSNLISGFADAAKEGARYTRTLDEIADRQVALGLQTKNIELEIIQNRAILKDREADLESRKFAADEIVRLEQEKLDKTKELRQKSVDNDLEAAAFRSKISKEEVEDIITNYDKYVGEFDASLQKEAQLRERFTVTTTRKIGDSFQLVQDFDEDGFSRALKNQGEELNNNLRLAIGYKQIDDDLRIQLESSLGGLIDANKEYERGKERLVTLENTLLSELNKQDKVEETITANVEKQADIKKKLSDDVYKNEINNLRKIAAESGDEDFIDILDAELDAELAKIDEEVDAYVAGEEAKTKSKEAEQAKRDAINDKAKEVAIAAINGAFDIYQNSLTRQSQILATQKEYELSLAEGNATEQAAINEKFEKKEVELQKKKDKSEKTQALFNIALSTAQAIASVSPVVPLMILAGALGAIQLAVAASTPLPQYYTGIDSVPTDSPVMVGDRGRELIKKDGKMMIANQPTIATGLKGAKVWNNAETEMMLSGRSGGSSIDISELSEKQDTTNKYLKNFGVYDGKKVIYPNLDKIINKVK